MSNNNDPLVEAVARAMYASWWETIDTCTDGANCESCPLDRAHSLGKARAAIKAVLGYYSRTQNITNCMVNAGEQERGAEATVAAAMSAELQRREG